MIGPLTAPERPRAAQGRNIETWRPPPRALNRGLRIGVAVGLTGYLLWISEPGEVLAAARAADWRWLGMAAGLVLVDRALMAYRWILLLSPVEPSRRPPLTAVLRIFFVSTFVGTFLPSVGGDALRAYSLTRFRVRGSEAVASVLMDRILGVASILLMALFGLTLARNLAGDWAVVAALAAAAAVCAIMWLFIFNTRIGAAAVAVLARLPGAIRDGGQRLLDSIRLYATFQRQLVIVLFFSIAVQALRIMQAYYLGRGLGIDAAVDTYFAVIPLILLVMLLPVTISGLGTGQAAFLWFFEPLGVDASLAFTLSVLFIGLGMVGNVPGGLLYAWGAPEK